jgi:hypothetical protein
MTLSGAIAPSATESLFVAAEGDGEAGSGFGARTGDAAAAGADVAGSEVNCAARAGVGVPQSECCGAGEPFFSEVKFAGDITGCFALGWK